MTEQVNRKYEFVEGDTINIDGAALNRIRAVKDFHGVNKGDLGGYIEKEENLSHQGDCWVDDYAKVFNDAWVHGDAQVYGYAQVYGDAEVYGNAQVYERAEVYGDAQLCGDIAVTDCY